jgi:hypothetical protein
MKKMFGENRRIATRTTEHVFAFPVDPFYLNIYS